MYCRCGTGGVGELSLKKSVCGDDNQLADHKKPNVVSGNLIEKSELNYTTLTVAQDITLSLKGEKVGNGGELGDGQGDDHILR